MLDSTCVARWLGLTLTRRALRIKSAAVWTRAPAAQARVAPPAHVRVPRLARQTRLCLARRRAVVLIPLVSLQAAFRLGRRAVDQVRAPIQVRPGAGTLDQAPVLLVEVAQTRALTLLRGVARALTLILLREKTMGMQAWARGLIVAVTEVAALEVLAVMRVAAMAVPVAHLVTAAWAVPVRANVWATPTVVVSTTFLVSCVRG